MAILAQWSCLGKLPSAVGRAPTPAALSERRGGDGVAQRKARHAC